MSLEPITETSYHKHYKSFNSWIREFLIGVPFIDETPLETTIRLMKCIYQHDKDYDSVSKSAVEIALAFFYITSKDETGINTIDKINHLCRMHESLMSSDTRKPHEFYHTYTFHQIVRRMIRYITIYHCLLHHTPFPLISNNTTIKENDISNPFHHKDTLPPLNESHFYNLINSKRIELKSIASYIDIHIIYDTSRSPVNEQKLKFWKSKQIEIVSFNMDYLEPFQSTKSATYNTTFHKRNQIREYLIRTDHALCTVLQTLPLDIRNQTAVYKPHKKAIYQDEQIIFDVLESFSLLRSTFRV